MKQVKKVPRKQLEKFSTIFSQLGLVLALFIVFVSLEYQTEQKEVGFVDPCDSNEIFEIDITRMPVFVKEEAVRVKEQQKQTKIVLLDEIEPVVEEPKVAVVIDPVVKPQKIKKSDIIEKKIDEEIDEEDDPKPVIMSLVSKIPVFEGCENLSEEEGRKCFDKKINKLVSRHFNTGLADDLGLKNGKHKIYTQFVIDKTGKVVDVKVGTKNTGLELEAKRVVDKIPNFTPGERNGKKVSVKYTLPINFYVE